VKRDDSGGKTEELAVVCLNIEEFVKIGGILQLFSVAFTDSSVSRLLRLPADEYGSIMFGVPKLLAGAVDKGLIELRRGETLYNCILGASAYL